MPSGPIPEAVELVLEDLDQSDLQARNDQLADFLVTCYPTLKGQNN